MRYFLTLSVTIMMAATGALGTAFATDPDAGSQPDHLRLAIDATDCRKLARYQPAPGVTYQPGVDVRGKPVVPAEAGGGLALRLPDQIEFDLTVDLKRFSEVLSDAKIGDAASVLGRIGVDLTTGAVTFNGVPLSDAETARAVAACRAAGQSGGSPEGWD